VLVSHRKGIIESFEEQRT
jgi:hypothetical protein